MQNNHDVLSHQWLKETACHMIIFNNRMVATNEMANHLQTSHCSASGYQLNGTPSADFSLLCLTNHSRYSWCIHSFITPPHKQGFSKDIRNISTGPSVLKSSITWKIMHLWVVYCCFINFNKHNADPLWLTHINQVWYVIHHWTTYLHKKFIIIKNFTKYFHTNIPTFLLCCQV